jgi:hypothetical protein
VRSVFNVVGTLSLIAVFQLIGVWLLRAAYELVAQNVRETGEKKAPLWLLAPFALFIGGLGAASAFSFTVILFKEQGLIFGAASVAVLAVIGIVLFRLPAASLDKGIEFTRGDDVPEEPPDAQAGLASAVRRPLGVVISLGSCLFLSAAFLAAVFGKSLFGTSREWLSSLIVIEFLAIHSFPIAAFVALIRARSRAAKAVKWTVFIILMNLYMVVAATEGVDAFMTFVLCAVVTYVGFMLRPVDSRTRIVLGVRWGISYGLYVGLLLMLRAPSDLANWRHDYGSRDLLLGCLYFLLLGISDVIVAYSRELRQARRRWLRRREERLRDEIRARRAKRRAG